MMQKLKHVDTGLIPDSGSSTPQAVAQASRPDMQLKAGEVAFHACGW